jgi:uncharacterized membrane protein YheB (UPF0754 family)
MQYSYILIACIPFISAFIGWLTNFFAVRMIFHPRRPVTVLGVRIQGLIPRRKTDLARTIGETVERELLNREDIAAVFRSEEFKTHVAEEIDRKIEQFITTNFGANPMVAMMLSGSVMQQLKDRLSEEIHSSLSRVLERRMADAHHLLDFKRIVQEKIEQFELEKLESIVYTIASRELKAIELLGGVLGFFIGIVQVVLVVVGVL